MFYRLVQGGILGTWYSINGPVTYILQPGLLEGPGDEVAEMRTKWEQGRQLGESDQRFSNRVQDQLRTYYTTGSRGYMVARPVDQSVGFDTLARHVPVGLFPKQPADIRQGAGWKAANPAAARRGRISKATISPSPRRNGQNARTTPDQSQDDIEIQDSPTPGGARRRTARGGRERAGRARRSNSAAGDGADASFVP